MAKPQDISLDAGKVFSRITVKIKVKGINLASIRNHIGTLFLKIGGKIMACGVDVETEILI